MKKSSIIIGAVILYIIIMVAGIAAYVYVDEQQKIQQEQQALEKQQEKTPEELQREAERVKEEEIRRQMEEQIKKVDADARAYEVRANADAKAYELLAKANAEAEANLKIAESLTDPLIDYTYANAWNGELPRIISGDGGAVIVNAGDLIRSEE